MKKYQKNSIDYIVQKDLEQLINERDTLIEELKNQYINSKDLDFIVKTICTENAIIMELEGIIKKANQN